MSHRLHVWPWTRRIGSLVLRNWLAIALGRHVIAWRPLDAAELAHELEHVRQWQRYGVRFPLLYAWATLRALRAAGHPYADNRFEVAAREAACRARRAAGR